MALRRLLCLCFVALVSAVPPPAPPPSPKVPTGDVVHSWGNLLRQIDYYDLHVGRIVRNVQAITSTWFEVLAQYSNNVVGPVLGSNLRRDASEWTTYNKNVALCYATYRLLCDFFPGNIAAFNATMIRFGLDPGDLYSDPSSPVGVGNQVGWTMVEWYAVDGYNSRGLLGPTGEKYSDYTGYNPLRPDNFNPDRWQPLTQTYQIDPVQAGIFYVQIMESPYMARARTFAINVSDWVAAPPTVSYYTDVNAYKQQIDQILAHSAALTDEYKLKAEHFNNKYDALGMMGNYVARQLNYSQDQYIVYDMYINNVILDSIIAVWNSKMIYDRIRPETAVHWFYGEQNITAWAGPYQGVKTFPASHWHSYLLTMPHSEYPSGSTCLCYSFCRAIQLFTGSDNLNMTVVKPAGSSQVEPGSVPAQNLTLHWDTLSEYAADCGASRLWSGVHFQSSIDAGAATCPRIADAVYAKFSRYVGGNGTVPSVTGGSPIPVTTSAPPPAGSGSAGASSSSSSSTSTHAASMSSSTTSAACDHQFVAATPSDSSGVTVALLLFGMVGWLMFAVVVGAWVYVHRKKVLMRKEMSSYAEEPDELMPMRR